MYDWNWIGGATHVRALLDSRAQGCTEANDLTKWLVLKFILEDKTIRGMGNVAVLCTSQVTLTWRHVPGELNPLDCASK